MCVYILLSRGNIHSFVVRKEDCISLPQANETKLKSIKILQIVAFMFMKTQYLFVVLRKYMFAFALLIGIRINYLHIIVFFLQIMTCIRRITKLKICLETYERNLLSLYIAFGILTFEYLRTYTTISVAKRKYEL